MSEFERELRNLEERLLQPSLRRNEQAVADLLDDSFREIGASGRVYDKQATLAALGDEPASGDVSIRDFQARELTPEVALVTYGVTRTGGASLRSSIWIMRNGRWLLAFHQGTPAPR